MGSDAAEDLKELPATGSEGGQEPPPVPEVTVEGSGGQAGAEGDAEQGGKRRGTFIRFRKKIQQPKGESSNGWFLLEEVWDVSSMEAERAELSSLSCGRS